MAHDYFFYGTIIFFYYICKTKATLFSRTEEKTQSGDLQLKQKAMTRTNPQYNNTGFLLKPLLTILFAITAQHCLAITPDEIKFRNETSDTACITQLLIEECSQRDAGNVSRIARKFIGKPYAGGTLEGDSIETLRINLDEFDCTTFVETVLALAYTAAENRQSWRDYAYNLRRLRYRNGETDGYPSRLHYVSEWILDNAARGNLKDVTGDIKGARYNVKSLDYMTAHRDSYPALTDSTNFARMKNVESGFSNHRFPYLKGTSLKDRSLAADVRDGDIVCFTTSTKGLDVTHMAIITLIDGSARMIHASSKAGKVILDPLTITEYVKRNRNEGCLLYTSDAADEY